MQICKHQLDVARETLEAFEGTPHRQRRAIPGKGVDCIQLVMAVLQAARVTPPFQWPSYRQDVGFFLSSNSLADALEECFQVARIELDDWEPQDLDVGIFKVGRFSNHCGIVLDGRFWHVVADAPVHHCAISSVESRLQEAVRFVGSQLKTSPKNLQK